jgi:hypothetical protein
MDDGDLVADAARAIAGGPPPAWLVAYLRSALPTLRGYHASMSTLPTRKQTRADLDAIARHAVALAELLRNGDLKTFRDPAEKPEPLPPNARDGTLLGFLEHAAPDFMATDPDALRAALDNVAERARTAMAHIPAGGGQARARPMLRGQPRPPAMSPELFAALVVSICWEAVHGDLPGKRNEVAADAAAALWNAAIDPPADAPLTWWEGAFVEAKEVAALGHSSADVRAGWCRQMRATIAGLKANG